MKLTFTLELKSDYHIGAGHGSGTQIDSALLRDGDLTPVIRGSTIEGLLRYGLQQLLDTGIIKNPTKCRASSPVNHNLPEYCQKSPCLICHIFGTPAKRKTWRISSARPVGAEIPFNKTQPQFMDAGTQAVTRVKINSKLRKTEPRSLFKQEEGDGRFKFAFFITHPKNNLEAHHEATLLVAASRMIRYLGASRRRGRGECIFKLTSIDGWNLTKNENKNLQDDMLDYFKQIWIEDKKLEIELPKLSWKEPESTSKKAKKFLVLFRFDEPVIITKHSESGNNFDTNKFISGSTLLGALAEEAANLWDLNDSSIYENFLNVFKYGDVRFSPLYPTFFDTKESKIYPTIPAPSDLLVCKAHRDLDPEHLEFNNYSTKEIPSECPTCQRDIPLVTFDGFCIVRDGSKRKDFSVQPKLREEMHPMIDPITKRAATGNLFSYTTIANGQHYLGELWCKDDATWKIICLLTGCINEKTAFSLRLGKATGRGHGLVTGWIEQIPDKTDYWRGLSIDKRVTNLSQITLTLLTDTILQDDWGRYHQTFDEKILKDLLKVNVKNVRNFCKSFIVDNFNNKLGLPRWRDIAIKAGSAVGFEIKDPVGLDKLQRQMAKFENDGIGLRRNEGYGKIVFNHPIYNQGKGIVGTGLSIDDSLKLSSDIVKGDSNSIYTDYEFLHDWFGKLRNDPFFKTEKFQNKIWESFSRSLWNSAALPNDALKNWVSSFGSAKLLTNVEREPKEYFSKSQTKEALEHIKNYLKETENVSSMVRKIAIQFLANRIMGSVKLEES